MYEGPDWAVSDAYTKGGKWPFTESDEYDLLDTLRYPVDERPWNQPSTTVLSGSRMEVVVDTISYVVGRPRIVSIWNY